MSTKQSAQTTNTSGNWVGTETWQVRKSAITSQAGLVASHHHAASDVGASVLSDGGNAMDAAVAASLMIGTVEPWMSGLGGGGFMLYFDASSGRTHSVEFGMRAPLQIEPANYPVVTGQDADLFGWPAVQDERNVHGPHSVATPGYLAGLNAALERFGSRPFAELVQPAIQSARAGLSIDWYATLKIAASAPVLSQYPESARTYLPGGFTPAGEWGGPMPTRTLGNLADTLDTLRRDGAASFYHGDIASSIVKDAQAAGSTLSASDLQQYHPQFSEAQSMRYRDATVFTPAGMSAGPTLQDTLSRMQTQWQAEKSASKKPDTQAFLTYANALQAAYTLRLETLGDSDDQVSPACTTHMTLVDGQGNMVALTQTLLSVFGSKLMLPQSGILMNNGMMWFDPRPGRPNSIAGGKRPLSNMCPAMFQTAKGDRYALGASGGRRIMPAVMQLISFVVDYGMSVDAAMHQGRIDVSGAPLVCVDQQLDVDIANVLSEQSGHKVMRVPNGVYPVLLACPNLVCKGIDGTSTGAAFVMSPLASVASQAY